MGGLCPAKMPYSTCLVSQRFVHIFPNQPVEVSGCGFQFQAGALRFRIHLRLAQEICAAYQDR